MSELERKADRVIELLEGIAGVQAEMHVRQKRQFRMYAASAALVWIVYGALFLIVLYGILDAIF